ncbi:hypothetical protein VNI00_009622 [Paramarasmius palmivorus]|uniref:Epoxide hydrolase N-terminal domain-containing protein n=1 Tax=Paramarasmius palmivorus TaxID=297713 RepID=A0AAW0CQ74_9AGAR
MESPFIISIPEMSISLLRQKLDLVRFPDELDDAGWLYGAPLNDVKRLVNRWKDGYNWKAHEKSLNDELPQFIREIEVDGFGSLSIHYVHKRSEITENAIPLLFVHGWPGSFVEARKILPLLTTGTPSFHVVAVGLPGYGFSEGSNKKGFSIAQYAEARHEFIVDETETQVGHKLMLALGYNEYANMFESDTRRGLGLYRRHPSAKCMRIDSTSTQITRAIAATYGPTHVKAWHTNLQFGQKPETDPPEGYTDAEKAGIERSKWFEEKGSGYFAEQSTQPQTLGYSLSDSPVGLLAWIYEKLVNWTDSYPWEDDEILTWVSIYWFSRSGPAASIRIYYEYMQNRAETRTDAVVPLGNSYFPKDLWVPPRSWINEKNLVFESRHDSGGHFAAHEKPDELVDDLRKMFGRNGPAFGVVAGKDGY